MSRLFVIVLGIIALAAGIIFASSNTEATQEPASDAVTAPSDNEAAAQGDENTGGDIVLEEDIERPAWQLIELTDATTGETFTLGDFYGQTVFVEPMATWCTNCRSQLRNVAAARSALEADGVEDVIFIGLSLEINLSDERLADYQENQGFDWTFAVMNEDILVELVEEFGRSTSVAPSTPHFVIRADGTYTDLTTGIESTEEIQSLVLQAIEDSAPTAHVEDDEAQTANGDEAITLDIERRPWQLIELTDATTGEAFTLADFDGQTVFIEPVATWCSNCRAQRRSVNEAKATLDAEDVIFIALSLETNLDDNSLADYAAQQGFDLKFAVMNQDLLVALIEDFGRSVSNAPSTPHFIINPDGSVSELSTGSESTEELIEQINTARGA